MLLNDMLNTAGYLKIVKLNILTGEYKFIRNCHYNGGSSIDGISSFYDLAVHWAETGIIHKDDKKLFLKYFNQGYLSDRLLKKDVGRNITLYGLRYKVYGRFERIEMNIITDSKLSADYPYALICLRTENSFFCECDSAFSCGNIIRVIYKRLSDGHTEPVYLNVKELIRYESISASEPMVSYNQLVHENDREEFISFVSDENMLRTAESGSEALLCFRRLMNNSWIQAYIKLIPDRSSAEGNAVFVFICKAENNGGYPCDVLNAEEYLLTHDIITGTGNKDAFESLCRRYKSSDEKNPVGILYTNLPNEIYSSETKLDSGIEALRKFAFLLSDSFGRGKVYRLSANEFAVLSSGIAADGFIKRAKRFIKEMEKHGFRGVKTEYTLSIESDSIEMLLDNLKIQAAREKMSGIFL